MKILDQAPKTMALFDINRDLRPMAAIELCGQFERELASLRALNAELLDHLLSVANAIDNGGLKRPSDWAKRLRAAIAKAQS